MKSRIAGQQILKWEGIGFSILFAFLWVDEIADLPHRIFGAPATPINYSESIIESSLCLIIGVACIYATRSLLRRVKYLEEFLVVCAHCHRIRINDTWISFEEWLLQNSDTQLSHGLCEECISVLYPSLADKYRRNRIM